MRRLPISIALLAALVGQLVIAAPLHAASPYLLPVRAGTTVLVFQGNNSAYDHTAANGSQYAWDFTVGATEFPVVAARGGTVIGARSDSTNMTCYSLACWTDANYVLIDHGDKTSALYLHLKTGSVAVKVGQTVAQGTFLGNADSTGFSYGTHLHFMVEMTPTSRAGSSWWWTQSLAVTFADAGLPLVDQSYTSQNVAQAAATPTPTPTPQTLTTSPLGYRLQLPDGFSLSTSSSGGDDIGDTYNIPASLACCEPWPDTIFVERISNLGGITLSTLTVGNSFQFAGEVKPKAAASGTLGGERARVETFQYRLPGTPKTLYYVVYAAFHRGVAWELYFVPAAGTDLAAAQAKIAAWVPVALTTFAFTK